MPTSEHLWECSVCCVRRAWSWPRTPCSICGAHQLTLVGGRSVDAAVANGAMCEVDALVRAYMDDVAEMVEIFEAMDPSGGRVPGEYGETVFASGQVNDTERPPPMFTEEEAGTFAPVAIVNDADELPLGAQR